MGVIYEYNFHSMKLMLGLSDLSPSGLSNIIRKMEQSETSILNSSGNAPLVIVTDSIKLSST